MEPTASELILQGGTIPLHWGWFEVLSILTLVLHLLLMNTLVGGGTIALVNHFRGKSGALLSGDIKRRLPVVMAFTINLGIAPLLFLQVIYGSLVYSSQVLMAAYVLAIIGLLILGYYCLYLYQYKSDDWKGAGAIPLALGLTSVLIVGFIFVNIMTMMLKPELWQGYQQEGNGTLLAVGDQTFWPKYLHMMTGAVAIGGLFVALVWKLKGASTEGREAGINTGLAWFRGATLVQIGIGFLFFSLLPAAVQQLFLGGNLLISFVFWLSIATALLSLHFAYQRMFYSTLTLALTTVVLMVINRAAMRGGYLGMANYDAGALNVSGELSPFVMFAVTLVIGLAVIYWMVRTYIRSRKEA